MSANTELAGKILQSIADHPEEHKQASWIATDIIQAEGDFEFSLAEFENDCGTTACIAGWALLHEGYTFKIDSSWDEKYEEYDTVTCALKEGRMVMDHDYGRVASKALANNDQNLAEAIRPLFHDMNEEFAIAKLTHLYFLGRLPEFTFSVSGGDRYEGLRKQKFVDKWYGQWIEAFPPSKEKTA